MDQDAHLLIKMLKSIGLSINIEQQQRLLDYVQMIVEGLCRQRLVGTRDKKELIGHHLCDCLYPLKFHIPGPGELLDLGTGAGLPGIPLKICLPGQHLYLLDSNQRKINFLISVSERLGLENVYTLPGRAEDWARDAGFRERFDTVVSRAVADTAVLAELALPLTKIDGDLLLYKGPRGEAELAGAAEALRLLGGEIHEIYRYTLPLGAERMIIRLRKAFETPHLYPRKAGMPVKKPLSQKK